MLELIPSLWVDDAGAAIDWYRDVLDAVVVYDAIVVPDGRIAYVELAIDGSRFTLCDMFDGAGVAAPVPGRGTNVALHLSVSDVDAVVADAVAAGGSLDCGPKDRPLIGRVAILHDPFGHRWVLGQSRD